MPRLIKRYGGGSRKLYDTTESRYVSLEEIAAFIRAGDQVRVVDNATGDDVSAQTLAQVILEAEKRGATLGSETLHGLIALGERALSSGVGQLQSGVDRLVKASVGRLTPQPLREMRDEMSALRARLETLEAELEHMERPKPPPRRPAGRSKGGATKGRKKSD